MAIRSTGNDIAVENSFHIFEVDFVVTEVVFALLGVPIERANSRER
jgi:hypothetical protein